MVRVLSIVCAAVALFSTAAVAKKSDVVQQYTVSCSKTYIVKNGDTVSTSMRLSQFFLLIICHISVVKLIKRLGWPSASWENGILLVR